MRAAPRRLALPVPHDARRPCVPRAVYECAALTRAARGLDHRAPSSTDYTGYGKGLIKKFKMSPDAYAQMAIQLAYYRLKGTVRATYESAQTRKYLAGRTEVGAQGPRSHGHFPTATPVALGRALPC